jgi:hypothetical protein
VLTTHRGPCVGLAKAYSPKCVEQELYEVRIQDAAYFRQVGALWLLTIASVR